MDIIDRYYNFACLLWHKKNCSNAECQFNLAKFLYEITDNRRILQWCEFIPKPTDKDLLLLDLNEVLKMVENQPYEASLKQLKENPLLFNFIKKYLKKEMKKEISDDDIINFSANTL